MTTIVDYLGRPIETKALTEELAAPTTVGVRQLWYSSVANSLTAERLGTIVAQVDQNDILEYLTLAEEMEERDLHYASVLGTRKRAVAGLPASVEAISDDAQDVEISDMVRLLVESDAFDAMLPEALDAIGKGFSAVEIMWDRSGKQWMPSEYRWRDPRFFQFDRISGAELRLRDEANVVDGLPLAPYKFISHRPRIKSGLQIRGGLARLAVVAYMCKGYTLKDWMAFMEVFGMPIRVGKYGPDATKEQKAALLAAVCGIGTDAACIIPDAMLIEFIEGAKTTGGDAVFMNAADWLDRQVSKGVLGQTASTEGTPGKLGADDAQENVRDDITISDAKQLSATLRRDLIKPFVDLNFGPRAPELYPKFKLAIEELEDLVAMSQWLPPLVNLGLEVEESVIRDLCHLPEPEPGAKLLKARPTPQPIMPGQLPGQRPGAPAPDDGSNDDDAGVDDTTGDEETEDELEQELQRERRKTVLALMAKVRQGETLTADQRALLVAAVASSRTSSDGSDELDQLAEKELKGWRKVMDPILAPVLAHAKASGSYQEFLEGLEGVLADADSRELVQRLATATFKARGLGNGTDKV